VQGRDKKKIDPRKQRPPCADPTGEANVRRRVARPGDALIFREGGGFMTEQTKTEAIKRGRGGSSYPAQRNRRGHAHFQDVGARKKEGEKKSTDRSRPATMVNRPAEDHRRGTTCLFWDQTEDVDI